MLPVKCMETPIVNSLRMLHYFPNSRLKEKIIPQNPSVLVTQFPLLPKRWTFSILAHFCTNFSRDEWVATLNSKETGPIANNPILKHFTTG